jgi:competence protein ComEA
VLPPRDPVVSGGGATGLADAASSGSGPSSGGLASGSSGAVAAGGPIGTQASTASDAGQVRVYVVGQVRRPGVVTLPVGARVEDAVQAVGGAGAKADLAVMNLARKVVDGERIVVPRPGEKLAATDPIADPGADPVTGAATGGAGGATAPGPGAPVDLNTATVAQLDALPGVGPVIAARIIAWRQENGRFSTVDDLSEVQGIGDATMTKLRPLVRV